MAMSAIDTVRMRTLCNDIQDYLEKTQLDLRQIYDTLDNTKVYLKGTNNNAFFNKVSDLQTSVQTITSNLSTYIDDYNAVINSYIVADRDITSQIKYDPKEQMKEES